MNKSLSEIVSLALASHEASTKVASLQDAPTEDPGQQLLDEQLGLLVVETTEEKVASAPESEEPKTDTLGMASHGMKLASALRLAADAVKVALEHPAVHESGHLHEGGVHPSAPGAPGKELPTATGAQGAMPTDDKVPSQEGGLKNSPGAKKVASATERLLQAKVAEHNMLVSLGQTEAAKVAAAEVKVLKTKLAEQAELPNDGGAGGATATGTTLSNEALINMTRAQARDASVRQTASILNTPVRVDNAVKANIGKDDGVKVSGVSGAVFGPVGAAIADKEHRGSSFGRTYLGASLGSAAGLVPGAALAAAGHKLKNDKLTAAGLGLAAAGGLAGQMYGGHKGQESARKAHAEKKKQEKK